jgi:hypothetical protein
VEGGRHCFYDLHCKVDFEGDCQEATQLSNDDSSSSFTQVVVESQLKKEDSCDVTVKSLLLLEGITAKVRRVFLHIIACRQATCLPCGSHRVSHCNRNSHV